MTYIAPLEGPDLDIVVLRDYAITSAAQQGHFDDFSFIARAD